MVRGVYKILEKTGPRAKSVYSKIQGPGRFLLIGVYRSSKSPGPGRISILKFSGPRQALVLGRIQKLEKSGPRARTVYSKIPGPGRFLVPSVYKILEKLGQGEICILKNSGSGQVPGPRRILVCAKN